MDIGLGASREKNPILAAKEITASARKALGRNKADFGLLFSSSNLSCNAFLKTVSDGVEGTPIVGSTAAAIISDSGAYKEGSVLLLVKLSEGSSFSVNQTKNMSSCDTVNAGKEAGEKLLYGFQNIRRTMGIFFANKFMGENSNFLSGLREKVGMSFPVIGNFSSDENALSRSYTYFNQDLQRDSCVNLFLGGKIHFGMGIRHGWKPLGKPHIVTQSNEHFVESIDDLPAVKLFEDYLGKNAAQIKKDIRYISSLYPLGIRTESEAEYLLRNIKTIEPNGILSFRGNVPRESVVRIMIGTKETCLDAARLATAQAKASMPRYAGTKPKEAPKQFALVFNSIWRYNLLKKDVEKELNAIKSQLDPGIPVIGVYNYGTLTPLKTISYMGQIYFNNQSILVMIIGD